jgi:hypothetical protein
MHCHSDDVIEISRREFKKEAKEKIMTHFVAKRDESSNISEHTMDGFGAATPLYTHVQASPNPNGLNPNDTVGKNSVGIAAPGDSGPLPMAVSQFTHLTSTLICRSLLFMNTLVRT